MARALYRPFEDADFGAIAKILQRAWHSDSDIPNDAYGYLEASMDLAHCLSVSTFSQVAVNDDRILGIVLARAANDRNPRLARWGEAAKTYEQRMEQSEPRAAQAYRDSVARTQAINAMMLEQSGLPATGELVLLAVDSEAHGLGIGSVLFDAVSSYLAACGEAKVYVYTDSDCTWSFYEQHGCKRMARYRSHREERHILPREMYMYGLDLSA